jgi:hypothetical protein
MPDGLVTTLQLLLTSGIGGGVGAGIVTGIRGQIPDPNRVIFQGKPGP